MSLEQRHSYNINSKKSDSSLSLSTHNPRHMSRTKDRPTKKSSSLSKSSFTETEKRASILSIAKKYPKAHALFENNPITVLEYQDLDPPGILLQRAQAVDYKLHDPWTQEERKEAIRQASRERMHDEVPEEAGQMGREEEDAEFKAFLEEWSALHKENEETENQDRLCMEKLRQMDLQGTSGVLQSRKLRELFQEYRKLELQVRTFKNLQAVRFLRIFISKDSVSNVRKFLEFFEEYFEEALRVQKRVGLTGRSINLPKLNTADRLKVFEAIKFTSQPFQVKWLQLETDDDNQSLGMYLEASEKRSGRKSKLTMKKRKSKPLFPIRWQGYIRLFADLNLEWKKLMRALVENYLKCINTATIQALMSYDTLRVSTSGDGRSASQDPLELIKFLLQRPIPQNMLRKPYVPPDLFSQLVSEKPKVLLDVSEKYDNKRYVNPLLRTDRYYSRNRQACDKDCKHHEGKLLLLLINLGKFRVVKYCLENGFKANVKVCGIHTKQLKWIEDFHPDKRVDDTFGIRVSTYEMTTPLATAAEYVSNGGDPEIVFLLLQKGAKPLACNDLALRACASTIRSLSSSKVATETFNFHQFKDIVHSRRAITASAHKILEEQWKSALQVWKQKNDGLTGFKFRVAETKAKVHMRYYFDVAYLYQGLLENHWAAVDKILGIPVALKKQNATTGKRSHIKISNYTQSTQNLFSSSKRLVVEKNANGPGAAAWKRESNPGTQVIHVFEGIEEEPPLEDIVRLDKRKVVDKIKVLDHYYKNSEKRGFSYSEDTLLISLRTLDRLLVAGLRSSSKNLDNSLQLDAAGNSYYILPILVLLEKTRLNLDNKRLRYLVALLVKALTEFKPGDQLAVMYMLKNTQIQSYLGIIPRVLLSEDSRNVVNLVKDKCLQIVFEVPKIKKRNRLSVKGNTMRRAKGTLVNMSKMISPGISKKKSLFGKSSLGAGAQANLRNVSDNLMDQRSVKSAKSFLSSRTKLTKDSKMSKASKTSKASKATVGDEYSAEIEQSLLTDLVEKAGSHGFITFVQELISSGMLLDNLTIQALIDAAMVAHEHTAVNYAFQYAKNCYQKADKKVYKNFLVRSLFSAISDNACSVVFLQLLDKEGITLGQLVDFNSQNADFLSSWDAEQNEMEPIDLKNEIIVFLIDTICCLELINLPRNGIGNIDRKLCFRFILSKLKDKTLSLELDNLDQVLQALVDTNDPIWAAGLLSFCEELRDVVPNLMSDKWINRFMKRIGSMKRPRTLSGKREMMDLLEYFLENVQTGKGSNTRKRILNYRKKVENDMQGKNRKKSKHTNRLV